MAIKKDAAKADIGPKKQVKATFAECKAVEPLKCKYHGLKALDKMIGNILASSGHPMPFVTDKHDNEYELRLPGDIDLPMSTFSKISLSLANKGFSIYNKGLTEEGAFKYQIKPVDGKEFVTPDGESEKEDADTLSVEDAPEKKKEDPFAELENMDVDALLNDSELDADLMDNFDELDEVVGDAEKDLEAELIGNSDFDDIVFFDDEGNEKEDGKETPPTLSVQDIKDLVAFKGVKEENFEQNPDLLDSYKAIITNGKNPNGDALNEHQKVWWNDLLDKTKEANPDELPALKVLKETMKKVNRGGGDDGQPFTDEQKPKTLTEDDIVAAFSPAFTGGDLATDSHFKDLYKSVITNHLNPNGKPLTDGQLSWFKMASEKAHAAGVNNYAVELLDKMLVDKGVMKNGGDNNEGEMEKYAAKWNNLMDTAINGKHLLGTQYWAETLQPIVDAYNDAVEANDAEKAYDAVYDLKNAVKDAPESKVEKPTKESLIEEMQSVIDKIHNSGLDLTWDAKKGMALGDKFGEAINANDIEGAAKALDNFKAYIKKLETGDEETKMEAEQLTADDIKDFFKKCGIKKSVLLGDENLTATKEALETGKFKGKDLTDANLKWYQKLAKKVPDHKVAQAINAMLESGIGGAKAKNAISGTSNSGASPSVVSMGGESSKEALLEALNGGGKSMAVEGMLQPLEHDDAKFPQKITQDELDDAISKGKQLGGHGGLGTRLIEIDGKKYVCKAATGTGASVIKNGYNADMAYRAGGVYAPDAKLYTFDDGKVYKLSEFIPGKRLIDVWQTADEAKREEIRKDLLKGYPLDVLFSNYDVLGTSPEDSITVTIQGADGKPQKTHVAFNNIMIGDDGHAYRVDNDGSFAMTGTGGIKGSSGGGYTTSVESEKWGNWEDRQWIDDFRTLRRNEKNLGIFDRYSTADIFLSAGNINLDAVVGTLPKGIQKALAKPLFEMKQMTWRAVNISLGGYKNNDFISMALDASYEASKRGLRELCKKNVSWNDSGFGKYKKSWGAYQMKDFTEPEPEEPQDPRKTLQDKLDNSDYTGKKIISILLGAVKTINNHGGVKQTDTDGNVLGNGYAMSNPDYKPNPSKIAEWEKIDREKLEELAKTDSGAATCLGIYDTIAYSKANGWKKPIGQIPTDIEITAKLPQGFQSPTEKKILDDMAGAIAQYKKDHDQYENVTLPEYLKRKSAHIQAEEEKAKKAGGSIYHNFHHFAELLMGDGMNTDGVMYKVKNSGIAPIEDSMHAQKGSSYAHDAVKWKIREFMALGYTPEQILEMAKKGELYNAKSYENMIEGDVLPHKDEWAMDMASQAMYLGMNMVKMENEVNDVYDKKSGVIFLNRNITNYPQGLSAAEEALYKSSTATGWVGPHIDSAADCMQFEKNSWGGQNKQVYAVPLSRIVCCANNETATGTHQDYGYDENEYVGNLYQLPCWVYHPSNNLTWKNAIDKAKKSSGMMGMLKKFASRLGFFNTLTA